MKNSKVLININDISDVNYYREIGISNFLFGVEGFTVGYTTFKLDDIPDNSYLLMNRVLDTKGINAFKEIMPALSRFKGIIFEDLGIFNLCSSMNIELIWNQAHFVTNYESLNYYLKHGCTSAVLSNEITKEEIEEIINLSNKPIIFTVFAKNMAMYSRRKLLSNFNKYNNLEDYNNMTIHEDHTKNDFYIKENEYGSAVFSNDYFNYIKYANTLNDNKIKFYLVHNFDLDPREINEILNGKEVGTDGFLNKKTVYKMSEYNDR